MTRFGTVGFLLALMFWPFVRGADAYTFWKRTGEWEPTTSETRVMILAAATLVLTAILLFFTWWALPGIALYVVLLLVALMTSENKAHQDPYADDALLTSTSE